MNSIKALDYVNDVLNLKTLLEEKLKEADLITKRIRSSAEQYEIHLRRVSEELSKNMANQMKISFSSDLDKLWESRIEEHRLLVHRLQSDVEKLSEEHKLSVHRLKSNVRRLWISVTAIALICLTVALR